MTVHRVPVRVRVELTVRGVHVTTFPLTENDLQWVQDATLLLDISPPVKKQSAKTQEDSE